ncbi:MAG: hypothetical protein HY934_00600, partial [Candidatus Firestonebacteria bacterium]|nr:hypothetical protein [Candidatus Firestonebacteria bacterium]
PYVKRISVTQNSKKIYEAIWDEIAVVNGQKRELRITTDNNSSDRLISAQGNMEVEVEFSKEIEAVKVNNAVIPIVSISSMVGPVEPWEMELFGEIYGGRLYDNGKIWKGRLDFSKLNKLEQVTISNNRTFIISARDKSNHYKREGLPEYGYELDNNPETIAKCEASYPYNWNDYNPGQDKNHWINIINVSTAIAGNSNPDENESVGLGTANSQASNNQEPQSDRNKIKIFGNGYVNEMKEFLNKLNIKDVSILSINPSYKDLDETKILIVPTGGLDSINDLDALDEESQIKGLIESYVKNGGNLLVFSQVKNEDYGVVPLPEVETQNFASVQVTSETLNPQTSNLKPALYVYGCQTDPSCWDRSMFFTQYHPILSSFEKRELDIPVDGFVYQYPKTSEIILERNANYYPSLITYKLDSFSGYVVLTNQFSEWGAQHGQSSREDRNLVRDTVSWMLNPNLLFETTRPEGEGVINVAPTIELRNTSIDTTYYAKIFVMNPNREIVKYESIQITILPKEYRTSNVELTIDTTSMLGIWGIGYELGRNIEVETQNFASVQVTSENIERVLSAWAYGFAIRKKNIEEKQNTYEIIVAIESDKEIYYEGETGIFTIFVKNISEEEKNVKINLTLPYNPRSSIPEDKRKMEIAVPSKGEEKLEIGIGPLTGTGALWVTDTDWFGVTAPKSISYEPKRRGFWVMPVRIQAGLRIDKEIYEPGEEIKAEIDILNPAEANLEGYEVKLVIKNDLNTAIWSDEYVNGKYGQTEFLINFDSGSLIKLTRNILLDTTMLKGDYYIDAKIYNKDKIKAANTVPVKFQFYGTELSIEPELPQIWKDINIIKFNITNIGKVKCGEASIELSLYNQNTGEMILGEGVDFGPIEIGQKISLEKEMRLNWDKLKPGAYRFYYTLRYRGHEYAYYKDIKDAFKYIVINKFDKPWYRQGENLNMDLEVIYAGEIEEKAKISFEIAYLNWETTIINTYSPANKERKYKLLAGIPEEMPSGVYELKIEVEKEENVISSRIESFSVPGFKMEGEIVNGEMQNEKLNQMQNANFKMQNEKLKPLIGIQLENTGGVKGIGEYNVEVRDNTNWCAISEKKQVNLKPGEKYNTTLILSDQLRTGYYYVKLLTYDNITKYEEAKWEKVFKIGIDGEITIIPSKEEFDTTDIIKANVEIKNTSEIPIENGIVKIKIGSPYISLKQVEEKEEIVPLPDGYKESFDVLVNSSTHSPINSSTNSPINSSTIWLTYVGEDRNIYYAVGKIQTLTTDTDTVLITWQSNYVSATNYNRELREIIKEAEELYVYGKNKGLEQAAIPFMWDTAGGFGIKLAPAYNAGWLETEDISLPGVVQILKIEAQSYKGTEAQSSTQQLINSSTHQLNFYFSVGEKVYDTSISIPNYKVRTGWPKILNNDLSAQEANPGWRK